MQSLAFRQQSLREDDIAKARGTCTWLLGHDSYTTWLGCGQGLLWIKGNPGAGKSTLINFAVRTSKQRRCPNGQVVASFFFHGRGDEIQKTPLGLYRSLLNQILPLVPSALIKLTSTFRERCLTKGRPGKKWNWAAGELKEFLASTLRENAVDCPLFVYVDALDEGGERTAVELVEYFQELISAAAERKASLRICFSCRHHPIVAVGPFLEICVENENRSDIRAYVEGKLKNVGLENERAETIGSAIIDRAQGVFQWVVLVLPEVIKDHKKGKNLHRIQQNILKIPTDLSKLYKELLTGFDEDDLRQSIKLFQWICFAERPLSLRELQHALAIDAETPCHSITTLLESADYIETEDSMERRVKDLSRGLAEVKQSKYYRQRVVQLIHQSVNDYLVEIGLKVLQASIGGQAALSAHFQLSRSCIRYLAIALRPDRTLDECDYENEDPFDESSFPLLRYAASFWIPHVQRVEMSGISQTDLLQLLDWPSNSIIEK